MAFEVDSLMRSQREALGRILGDSGLDPADFDWILAPRSLHHFGYERVPALLHSPTDYWFGIGRDYKHYGYTTPPTEKGRRVVLTPGNESDYETHRHLSWAEVESHFQNWLEYLKRELGAIDFWAAVRDVSFETRPTDAADEPFTPQEQEVIAARLSQLEERIAEMESLSEEQETFIRSEFEELRDQLKQMRRRQWWKFFLGTIANFSINHLISKEGVRQLLDSGREIFQFLVGSIQLPSG